MADVVDLGGESRGGSAPGRRGLIRSDRNGAPTQSAAATPDDALLALTRLRAAEESARYARPGTGGAPFAGIVQDSQVVRSALMSGVSGLTRVRAIVLPPSTVSAAVAATRSTARSLGERTPKLGELLIAARRRLPKRHLRD
jgi:hypothetical protein